MVRIALFASGSGSNVENIAHYFQGSNKIKISKVYCNNPNAGVIDRCRRLGLAYHIFKRGDFYDTDLILSDLLTNSDAIVLAGFLWKVPVKLIAAFPNKIINVHPALLPKYGGKGMYGMHVHRAVKAHNEQESGITIHFVNENYDEGAIIFQAKTSLSPSDSAEDIAQKIHALEYDHFPQIIEETVLKDA